MVGWLWGGTVDKECGAELVVEWLCRVHKECGVGGRVAVKST